MKKVFTICGFEGTKDNSFTKENKSTNEIENQPVMTAGFFKLIRTGEKNEGIIWKEPGKRLCKNTAEVRKKNRGNNIGRSNSHT